MNTESNTMTTDLTNVDPALYTVLKKKQQEFIHILDRECGTDAYEMTRGTLKKIANDNGIAWAPAWIVKDISRAVKRGTYRVPELAAYRNYRDGLEADAIESDHTVIVDEINNRERFRESMDTTIGRAMQMLDAENLPMIETILD